MNRYRAITLNYKLVALKDYVVIIRSYLFISFIYA